MEDEECTSIGDALKMHTFINDFQKAYLNLLFTGNFFLMAIQKALRPFGITSSQYNVLRILRGQHGKPMCAIDIQNRMVYTNSNVSRILDKLLDKKLIRITACPENRRRNNIHITEEGLLLLRETESVPTTIFKAMEKVITQDEAICLNKVLDRLRQINTDTNDDNPLNLTKI